MAAQLATSDTPRAHEILAAFRLRPEPSILVTVAMAYEGLDAPEVAVVAALTHIRSRPWLEQMVARATRVDPHAGAYASQRALVFHPDDPLFAQFRRRLEFEQGTLARSPRPEAWAGQPAGLAAGPAAGGQGRHRPAGSPTPWSLRFDTLRPGPDLAMRRPELGGGAGGPARAALGRRSAGCAPGWARWSRPRRSRTKPAGPG